MVGHPAQQAAPDPGRGAVIRERGVALNSKAALVLEEKAKMRKSKGEDSLV